MEGVVQTLLARFVSAILQVQGPTQPVKFAFQFRIIFMLLALAYTTFVACHRNEAQGNKICDAAGKGNLGAVQSLVKENPKLVFSRDVKSNTPLHLAASHGYPEVVKFLLASNADVNARTKNGNAPIEWAAYNGHADVIALLLANKADVNAKDNAGWTPLHTAAYQGHKGAVELLIAN